MAGTAQLVVKVVSDVRDATRGLDQVTSRTDKMRRGLGTGAKVAGGLLLGLGAAAVSAGNAAADDAKQQSLLALALKKNAGASDSAVASTEDWIAAQAKATGVADDQLRPALATLVRATGDTATAQEALGTAMDVSAATGKDVESVSAALAKGYAGNTGALNRLVPGLDQAAIKSGDMAAVMADLADKTGGAAAEAADTAAGKTQIMANQMAEAQESIGTGLLPVMALFAGVLASVAGFVQNNTTTVQILVGVLAALAVVVIATNAALKAYRAAVVIATVAQWAWNAAMTANPIGIVLVLLALLVGAIVLAWKKSETFRTVVTGVWEDVQRVVGRVVDWVVDKATGMWDAITDAADAVGDALSGPFDAAKDAVGWLIGKVQDLIGWLDKIKIPSLPKGFGGIDLNPFSASPSAAGLGVMATSSPRAGTSTGPTIIVNGAMDPEAVARQVGRILRGHDRRVGLLP